MGIAHLPARKRTVRPRHELSDVRDEQVGLAIFGVKIWKNVLSCHHRAAPLWPKEFFDEFIHLRTSICDWLFGGWTKIIPHTFFFNGELHPMRWNPFKITNSTNTSYLVGPLSHLLEKWEAVMIHIFRYESVIASLFQSSLAENEETFQEKISVPTGFLVLHGSYGFYRTNHS